MKYTAWLSGNSGGKIEMDFPDETKYADLQAVIASGRVLQDRNGVLVNGRFVAALVPTVVYPEVIVDGEGDIWYHTGGGQYRIGNDPATFSFTHIKEAYGVREQGREGVESEAAER